MCKIAIISQNGHRINEYIADMANKALEGIVETTRVYDDSVDGIIMTNGVGITEEELLKEISFSFDNYNMIIEKLKRNVVFYSDIKIKLYNWILLLISIKNNKPEVFITYFSKEKKDAIYNNALGYYKSMKKKGIQVILDDNFK